MRLGSTRNEDPGTGTQKEKTRKNRSGLVQEKGRDRADILKLPENQDLYSLLLLSLLHRDIDAHEYRDERHKRDRNDCVHNERKVCCTIERFYFKIGVDTNSGKLIRSIINFLNS